MKQRRSYRWRVKGFGRKSGSTIGRDRMRKTSESVHTYVAIQKRQVWSTTITSGLTDRGSAASRSREPSGTLIVAITVRAAPTQVRLGSADLLFRQQRGHGVFEAV